MNYRRVILSFVAMLIWLGTLVAQQVPYGIHYQAVARNSSGDELANRQIDVRFSIRSGDLSGNLEYQEVHSGIVTSPFGVFDAILGTGTPVAGAKELFEDITWELDQHFLVVEIKFASEFLNMGAMQFLSVPYALYAGRSLEPGPEGPPGPAGDPATDDQTLSFDGTNLSIDGGNTVNLDALVNDPNDEIQYLSIAGDSLSITNGNSIKLQEINIDDADADPANEIQNLSFNSVNSELQIIGGNTVDLSPLVNTDNQQLSYNPVTHVLTITNGTNSIDLDDLKNDADASTTNELITSVSIVGSQLVIDEGSTQHSVDLSSNTIAFRARKNSSDSGLNPLADYDFIANTVDYNLGSAYNSLTGEFTAPITGLYTFNFGYNAHSLSGSVKMYIYVNNALYETLETGISGGSSTLRSVTMRLLSGQIVKCRFNTGAYTESGTGSFSGFRVY